MKAGYTLGWRWALALAAAAGMVALAGCGGGGGDDEGDQNGAGGGGGTFAGNYDGSFNGTDAGTWQIVVAGDGNLTGTAHSTVENLDYALDGSVTEEGVLAAGMYDGSLYAGTYTGTIAADGAVTGTWESEDGAENGSFEGQRN